ncbi:MAG: hypothetical protein JSW27_23505 [Phycisphaerales bacterium]|nr:MAG: hypothetical protein JSW27_23505 [Phycisphaerales bacterium]
MKKACVVALIVAPLVWGSGCSTAPEHLAFGVSDWDSANPGSSVGARVDAGSVNGGRTGSLVSQGLTVLGSRATQDEHGRIFVVGKVKSVGQATQGGRIAGYAPRERR